MSDIREAFEAIKKLAFDAVGGKDPNSDKALVEIYHACEAALQSQTAPAVPEGLDFDFISAVLEDYANLQTSGVIPCANRYSASDTNEQAELLDMLTAAPQPDHSPDGGEYEIRADGSRVRKDRWEAGFRSIVTYTVGPRTEFEIDDIVELVRQKFTPAADGGEVEPVAWAVFADNGNLRIWGREKPKAFPNAAPLYLRPTVKESLTAEPHQAESLAQLDSEDQKGMERIVEAVAHIGIDFGYGPYELEQCHIDRAREIKESLARLRSNGGDV